MKEEGLRGCHSILGELVVDGTWPDSKVLKWYLREVKLRQRRPPYKASLGDVSADLDGSFGSSTGSACASNEELEIHGSCSGGEGEKRLGSETEQVDDDTSKLPGT